MESLAETIRRSLLFYRKDAVNQLIIVLLLSAIISGSLFTGQSVRASLRKSASEKLGNTRVLISTGLRYFDGSLSDRISILTGEKAVCILESDGYCQNFSTGATALNTKIYGVSEDFWQFHGIDTVNIIPGTVAVNSKLAEYLGISAGDEIIMKFRDTDPIPENAPFSPSRETNGSRVMKVGIVLTPDRMGNFSLGVSQLTPMNVFMTISDLDKNKSPHHRVNRLLVLNIKDQPLTYFSEVLSKILVPSDLGLTVRRSKKTGEPEIVSDRIFIDSAVVAEIKETIHSATPLITYLVNNMQVGTKSTPYSFVTASGYGNIAEDNILITSWLADDLNANKGDTLTLTWYDPGYRNSLYEKNRSFIIKEVVADEHDYSDPSLMPDFPGISESATCSGWDAGVPILMKKIRNKDEEYWNKYRGTPKAFISYDAGRKIWGSNFGPATALRFPEKENTENIVSRLSGKLDPFRTGFSISDIKAESKNAAANGVDFSTLFLGLAIFIIISCLVLLSLAVSIFFDSREKQVAAYFALGFRNRQIMNLLLSETLIISSTGALTGVFLGYLLNIVIIKALNSVWRGAVQTNTLSPDFSLAPIIIGFISTIIIVSLLLLFKSRKFMKGLSQKKTGELIKYSQGKNLLTMLLCLITAAGVLLLSFVLKGNATVLTFLAGGLFFCTLIFGLRYYYLRKSIKNDNPESVRRNISRKFYTFNPDHAVTPVVFIAAGIFAVIITGANRQVISEKMLLPGGGTGGYLLWAESAVTVRQNLNSTEGREEFGLNEPELKDLEFVQACRLPGDDASCLNLNHVTSPSILGIDPEPLIARGSFSFASRIKQPVVDNPWSLLLERPTDNVVYGIADQTVLDWGLKIKTGDTLLYRTENGQQINIVICAGLKSSVFQGYLIIGKSNFDKYFPSVAGSSIFLADGNSDSSDYYREILTGRLSGYGISVMPASEKLASFFVVINTYLDVFMILGILGMILGIAGLGFILIRNFNLRKREFALMMATGYTTRQIRNMVLTDHILILIWGVVTGTLAGMTATLQSLRSGSEMPWNIMTAMIVLIIASGISAIFLSVRSVNNESLTGQLRRE